MPVNDYSLISTQLVSELQSELTPYYDDLLVQRSLFRPAKLPSFTRYAIIVTPSGRPWDEYRHALLAVQFLFRFELHLMVKNWTESTDDPLFGVTPGSLGLFQLIQDTKDLLRLSDLNGLLDKTYDEPGGDARKYGGGGVEFQDLVPGFDSAEYPHVMRARMPYLVRSRSFCHARL